MFVLFYVHDKRGTMRCTFKSISCTACNIYNTPLHPHKLYLQVTYVGKLMYEIKIPYIQDTMSVVSNYPNAKHNVMTVFILHCFPKPLHNVTFTFWLKRFDSSNVGTIPAALLVLKRLKQ